MAHVIKADEVEQAQVGRPIHFRRSDGSLIVVGEAVECRGVLIFRPAGLALGSGEGADPDSER